MKIDEDIDFIVVNKQANFLWSPIVDRQYRATSLGRDTWKTLIGSQASLQSSCSKETFNAVSTRNNASKAIIGILGNNENDYFTFDPRIGFGTRGYHFDSKTCGSDAYSVGDRHRLKLYDISWCSDKNIKIR